VRRSVRLGALAALGLAVQPSYAYRPFVSTDAAVAAHRALELEVGTYGFSRNQGQDAATGPQAVINYGIRDRFEAVGEFVVQHPYGASSQFGDAALDLKGIIREGVLQDKPGVSLAGEASLLLPSSGEGDTNAGFEQAFIASHKLGGFTFHWNAGGGWERSASLPFANWGLIAESPSWRGVRAVGELNGESVRGQTPDNSGLVGAIWETGWRDVALDAGYRRGLSAVSNDWSVTTGFSIAFKP
jgi:hypothetical protein